jgi:FdhD protein
MIRPLLPCTVMKIAGRCVERADDMAAAEEPLEIRLNGAPFVVIMRTPGADRELAAGFLLAERIIAGPDDLGVIRHCTGADGQDAPNVIDVTLGEEAARRAADRLGGGRPVVSTSACGVCGRRTIEDLMTGVPPQRAAWRVSPEVIAALPPAVRAAQPVFDDTGGLHAAALFDAGGVLVAAAEDVGRHNAVDKVIGGQLLRERLPLDGQLLFVSGRSSYEIVQKALVARIPIVASVSAPSSLAIDLARHGGVTLLGFVRGDTFNIYTGQERVELP